MSEIMKTRDSDRESIIDSLENDKESSNSPTLVKKKKPGIVHLGTIPHSFNVTKLTAYLANFGKIGRVYLQPEDKSKRKSTYRSYSQGWVEFKKSSDAKKVANLLHNQPISIGKKSNCSYSQLWNIQYSKNLKWTEINAREAEAKVAQFHRMRQEIVKAKRVTNFYANRIDQSTNLKKAILNPKSNNKIVKSNEKKKKMKFRQNKVYQDDFSNPQSVAGNATLFNNIFSGGCKK